MYESEQSWRDVDRYVIEELVAEDDALSAARETSRAAGLPDHEVAPNQAKLLALICQMTGARRVLEFGTLGGYSTIWFARAVGATGHVTTLEVDEQYAEVARANFERAGVADRINLVLGSATETVEALIAAGEEPYDVVFIDADKPNNPAYLGAALRLSKSGTVIIGDNIVRNGAVTDPHSDDPRVHGSRALIEAMGSDPRLNATALQTVGVKGWDGFALAVVT
ncbi:O-methyltransferase [Nocardia sp. CDC160]|uniref:O-methyltransferase n=1 Tax=Nocardia sp. CDC160 TaxID=3112166 RepID=UPI002DB8BBE1|nr:O-methyltransferase [Nocardia sp. CDC160]MEC3919954.1 O-methyltransferase [Nocardia sp. CDC160]